MFTFIYYFSIDFSFIQLFREYFFILNVNLEMQLKQLHFTVPDILPIPDIRNFLSK